ncbi:hypothetical protein ACFPMF_11250 [Larkinella bovis]|uniref:DNA-binding protein n=1 Tax=Larkinella bovis TaxID=683041 RepID=A0ABW0ICL1_9BACT
MNYKEESYQVPLTPIVSYEAFVDLYNQVQELKQRVEALKALTNPEWLNREQAMAYLKCSSTKLWALQRDNLIEFAYHDNGYSPLYSYKSCQEYLDKRSISKEKVEQRLKELLEAKQAKRLLY